MDAAGTERGRQRNRKAIARRPAWNRRGPSAQCRLVRSRYLPKDSRTVCADVPTRATASFSCSGVTPSDWDPWRTPFGSSIGRILIVSRS
jgi:hypothetical protein